MIETQTPDRPRDLVTIEIVGDEPDLLRRISLLHTALVRVLRVTRLVEVRSADYDSGQMEAVVERSAWHPSTPPGVDARYRPLQA